MGEDLELQLKERIQDSERLEVEIILLRNKLDEESAQAKFENSSNILDDILNRQKTSSDKIGLGYDKGKKPECSSSTIQDGNKRSHASTLTHSIEKEESKKFARIHNKKKTYMILRRPMLKRYQKIFLGHFYSCNSFGHKVLDCNAYQKHNQQYSYNNSNPGENPR